MAEPGGETGGEFAGLTALVTGGASGIGLATAQLLTSRGARVAVLDRDKADEKHGLISVVADVTDDDAVRRAVGEAVAALGDQLDILVNNAGHRRGRHRRRQPRRGVAPGAGHQRGRHGPGQPGRAGAPAPRRRRPRPGGDREHLLGRGHRRAAAARAVLGQQGRGLRADPGHGRRPRARGHPGQLRHPGTADTPWIGRLLDAAPDPEAERAALNARQPMGRLVTAAEVAGAITYLASPLSRATTGTALQVDAGMTGLRLRPPPTS